MLMRHTVTGAASRFFLLCKHPFRKYNSDNADL